VTTEYRIDFSITRCRDGEDDFTEVGFGSSGADESIDGALYAAESIIQRREWENYPHQPAPEDVDDDTKED